jgi:hypothetical protein
LHLSVVIVQTPSPSIQLQIISPTHSEELHPQEEKHPFVEVEEKKNFFDPPNEKLLFPPLY